MHRIVFVLHSRFYCCFMTYLIPFWKLYCTRTMKILWLGTHTLKDCCFEVILSRIPYIYGIYKYSIYINVYNLHLHIYIHIYIFILFTTVRQYCNSSVSRVFFYSILSGILPYTLLSVCMYFCYSFYNSANIYLRVPLSRSINIDNAQIAIKIALYPYIYSLYFICIRSSAPFFSSSLCCCNLAYRFFSVCWLLFVH